MKKWTEQERRDWTPLNAIAAERDHLRAALAAATQRAEQAEADLRTQEECNYLAEYRQAVARADAAEADRNIFYGEATRANARENDAIKRNAELEAKLADAAADAAQRWMAITRLSMYSLRMNDHLRKMLGLEKSNALVEEIMLSIEIDLALDAQAPQQSEAQP